MAKHGEHNEVKEPKHPDAHHDPVLQEIQEVGGEHHTHTPNPILQDPRFDQDPKMLTDLTARNPDIEPKPEYFNDPKLETDEMVRHPMKGQELRTGANAHGFQGDPKLLTDAEMRGLDPDTGEKPKTSDHKPSGTKPAQAGQRTNRKGDAT